jgi:hypothetical protein
MLLTKKVVTFKNLAIASATVLVLINIFRETGVINLNLYIPYSNYQTESSFHESSLSAAFDSTDMERIPHENITRTPIVVLDGEDTLFHQRGYGPAIILTVENLETGPIWLALYKPGYLHAQLRCRYDGGWMKRQGAYISGINMNLSGDIHVTGKITIIGPCSYKNALNLMKQTVVKTAVEKIQIRLQELENRFESPLSTALAGKKI